MKSITPTVRIAPDSWSPPLVVLIGTGMSRADLSAETLAWISRAEVLAGGRRHLRDFQDHPAERIVIDSPVETLVSRVLTESPKRRTLVLASGDPLFFGIGKRLIEALGRERIFTVPNVTSLQMLAARVGEPWGDVRVFTTHGRVPNGDWLRELDDGKRVFLLTDHRFGPDWIAERLIETGRDGAILVVGEDLGLPTERIRSLAPTEAVGLEYSALNVVLLKPQERHAGPGTGIPIFGIPESAFDHEAGLITKTEVRAVALAALGLRRGITLWDIGAGSGSVAIEASRLAAPCRVFAVEKHAARFGLLQRNIAALGHSRIEAIRGNAAEVIDGLPDPDRVFIGGSGKDLAAILETVSKRLSRGGRVVQTAVTLDTLDFSVNFWRDHGFGVVVSQVQVNRSAPIGQSLRFEALNPVFVISAWRPEP